MKTLILVPYKRLQCGMYQLAKDLAKEFNGDIQFKEKIFGEWMTNNYLKQYDKVITLIYPMHSIGRWMKRNNKTYWICYDQKIPPVTKTYFPNLFRRQAMKYINWRNNATMQGADEYWDVTEREQKPRWTEKKDIIENISPYALYLGRLTDYKNFDWLKKTMKELNIELLYSSQYFPWTDDDVHSYLSNATLLVTASVWEGYGRPVMEAQALDIPVVCFDVGVHKKLVKKGFVVENHNFDLFKQKLKELWQIEYKSFKELQ